MYRGEAAKAAGVGGSYIGFLRRKRAVAGYSLEESKDQIRIDTNVRELSWSIAFCQACIIISSVQKTKQAQTMKDNLPNLQK